MKTRREGDRERWSEGEMSEQLCRKRETDRMGEKESKKTRRERQIQTESMCLYMRDRKKDCMKGVSE